MRPFTPALRDGVCEVWWARRAPVQTELVELLDDAECERLGSFAHVADRERFLAGCVVIRRVLSRHLSIPPADVSLDRTCPNCSRQHGKVRVRANGAPRVEISLSHSGEIVVVAVHSNAPVGVDVERIDASFEPTDVSPLVLANEEAALLGSLDPVVRPWAFSRYWARKEAIVKATGEGLRASLGEMTVSAPHDPARLLGWIARPGLVAGVQLHDLEPGPGYAGALAVLSGAPVRIRQFDARWLDR
jgi:4'-phosphopantetheinyl transferase